MKSYFTLSVIIISFIFLTGMGELGGSAPVDKIPIPKKDFKVVVVDREGVRTSLSEFSHEGKIVIAGKRGSANVAIPFETISQVELKSLEGNEAMVAVSLREAKNYEVKVDKKSKFYGKAEFGTFQIEIKDLKLITFHP